VKQNAIEVEKLAVLSARANGVHQFRRLKLLISEIRKPHAGHRGGRRWRFQRHKSICNGSKEEHRGGE